MSARRTPRYPISIAPMMERTDRHFRFLMRQLTRHTLLYTEMITTSAILNGDAKHLLDFSPIEKPLVLQLGGDDPDDLSRCARIAEDWGYDEVNLNVGCPSDRVAKGSFGACLMESPELVAECVAKMRATVAIPITVKHRIGVTHDRANVGVDYASLKKFVEVVSEAGCDGFSVHARAAVLGGLSPKENRQVPPLRYEDVYKLKREFPDLLIEINGGIVSWPEVEEHLKHTDGVMIGRAAYDEPFMFARADEFMGFESTNVTRGDVIEAMLAYTDERVHEGTESHHIIRHMLGLFSGVSGARSWRRTLSELMPRHRDSSTALREASSSLMSASS